MKFNFLSFLPRLIEASEEELKDSNYKKHLYIKKALLASGAKHFKNVKLKPKNKIDDALYTFKRGGIPLIIIGLILLLYGITQNLDEIIYISYVIFFLFAPFFFFVGLAHPAGSYASYTGHGVDHDMRIRNKVYENGFLADKDGIHGKLIISWEEFKSVKLISSNELEFAPNNDTVLRRFFKKPAFRVQFENNEDAGLLLSIFEQESL